ncbi:dienelactone hydrolase [Shewanella sp. 10N.286.52.C2]|uniref:dienelactone hydrolase family protein n=1 Tax=Shewanella sp. 10N.286.52.C2 TaxID=1880838 RepID=UPI000C83212E|nr:dienelactone hydrolase family protein [Shewanella sp. 10N.286.52.C2]PMG32248.1 dienelactone hydrolase [Shewanella sp. 10N.286.52.C2]
MIITKEVHDIETPTGDMRTYVYRPDAPGQFASIIFYSEIFQQTAPIARSAAILAGHGFVVLVPEVFHELNPLGTVLEYDDVGKDKGNADKFAKPLEQHDSDTQAIIDFARSQAYCSCKVGAMGVCIGGHLAFRAALNPDISGAFCLYPTDIHSNTLPCEPENDSLTRCGDINCELVLVFGKQDPHVSKAGRKAIYQKLEQLDTNFSWLEVNAQHAFMRDEGERYDAALALQMYLQAVSFFQRTLK